MTALYCKQMERKIGSETCEQRQKDLVQFPYCENCIDYKNYTNGDTPTGPSTCFINDTNTSLVNEDLNNKFSNIDEAIETEKLNLRICKECKRKLDPTTKNFSLAGKNRVMLNTCKKCVTKIRKESNKRIKQEKENKDIKYRANVDKLQDRINILQEEIAKTKIQPKIETNLPTDISVKKEYINNKLSLHIDYLDLSISILLDKQ